MSKPHLVLDKMNEGSKGEDKEPSFPTVPVEIIPGKGDEDEKEERVAKYTAVTEGLSEEEPPYRFINDIGEKRAYEEKPYIQTVPQGDKGQWSDTGMKALSRRNSSRTLNLFT